MALGFKEENEKKKKERQKQVENNPIVHEIIFLVVLVVALLIAVSLIGWGGFVGNAVAFVLFGMFGAVAFALPFVLAFLGVIVISNHKNDVIKNKVWYGLGFYASVCGFVQWFFISDVKTVFETFSHSAEYHTRGGFIGGLLSYELSKLIGRAGDLILIIGLLFLFFILFSRKLLFHSMGKKMKDKTEEMRRRSALSEEELAERQMQIHTFDSTLRDEQAAHVAEPKVLTSSQSIAPKLDASREKPEKKSIIRRKKDMKDTAVLESVKPELPETDQERALADVHIRGIERNAGADDSGIADKVMAEKFGTSVRDVDDGAERSRSISSNELSSSLRSAQESSSKTASDFNHPKGQDDEIRRQDAYALEQTQAFVPEENSMGDAKRSFAAGELSKDKSTSDSQRERQEFSPEEGFDARAKEKSSDRVSAEPEVIPYQFPSLDLLSKPKGGSGRISEKELKETALKLQETLGSFGVGVSLGDISVGPSVTRYELIPDQGVKVSRITALADDIKLSLAASDIRIEAPIPGKSAVGIEVPNASRVTITLRELLESDEFQSSKSKLSFAVGKDISGKTIVTDIAKMPHVLVAGSTGSGKSVLINTLIMSIIFKADPNDVKLIMVDPKMVEFMAFKDIPHLMIPVVDDPKKASAALAWAVAEMEKRYKTFAELGIRDIATYNKKVERLGKKADPQYKKMPQIVIIVDEFADLMMVASHDVEDSVMRLAQKARAAGIHLVLATQRPSVNVITGVIKANIPSRIALSVSSQVDSRTIIDQVGAEKLLGNGDMLFAPQSLPKPIRVQGAFVSDDDRDKVVTFLREHGGAAYDQEVTESIESVQAEGDAGSADIQAPAFGNDRDEYFAEAGYFIIEKQKASIGALQRAFRIGFNRAARIMDQLSDAGVVGPEEGTKAREIIMTREQFDEYLANEADE